MTSLEETMKTRVKWNWPYTVQLNPNKRYNYTELSQWCQKNNILDYQIHLVETKKWSFKWEQDAIMFSLKWQ